MENTQKGVLLSVGLRRATIRCDLCRRKHLKCSRGIPKCMNCQHFNYNCTYEDARKRQSISIFVNKKTMQYVKDKVPLTWDQAIQFFSSKWLVQACVRRKLKPFEILLPKPIEATEIIKLMTHFIQSFKKNMNQTIHLKVIFHPNEIENAFEDAIEAFFCLYNPLYPLFSKEGFLSKPRSTTLLKVVIQIGLERMPSTGLIQAAILENNLTAKEINILPISLDALQCQLLVYYGVTDPHIRTVCLPFLRFTDVLFPLLGLHIPSRCLERTLAFRFFYIARHQIVMGQEIRLGLYIWSKTTGDHLKQDFTRKRPEHLSKPSDFIHFITSQTSFNSFATVLSARTNHTKLLKDKKPAYIFKALLYAHMNHIEKKFMWGWRQLSIVNSYHRALLRTTRFILALRYFSDYIELLKLGMYIPDDLKLPISHEPIKDRVTGFMLQGLNIALHSIDLAATINSCTCDFEFMQFRTIIPSVAFLILNFKPLVSKQEYIEVVEKGILQAKSCLMKSQVFFASRGNAKFMLALIDLLIKGKLLLKK